MNLKNKTLKHYRIVSTRGDCMLLKIKKFIKEYKYALLFSILFMFIFQYTIKISIIEVLKWCFIFPQYVLLNVSIIFLVFLIFNYLLNKIYSYIICITIFSLIALINYFKYLIRKSIFTFDDLSLIKELIGIWQNIFRIKYLFFICIIFIFYILIIKKVAKKHLFGKKIINKQLPETIVSIVILFVILFVNTPNSFSDSGYFYYIMSEIYSRSEFENTQNIKNIEYNIKKFNINNNIKKFQDKPNIVVVMSEAFWNPSLMKELKFNKNITENLNKIQLEGTYGYLKSPVFGGGTSNSEFEVLTGINIELYPEKPLMYNGKINNPVMSLASILNKSGYNVTTVHPNVNWYYNRTKNYEFLGVDNFISKEFMWKPEYKGFYIADREINKYIINTIKSSEKPDFIYAISMQNHGPYDDNRYKDEIEISVEGTYSKEDKQILDTYSQGIYDADRALGELVDELKKLNEPTIILFFGDHLPAINSHSNVFEKYNLELKDAVISGSELYLVPYVLYSTDGRIKNGKLNMNMFYMGSKLLDYTNVEKPLYYKFLDYVYSKYPIIFDDKALSHENKVFDDKNNDELKQLKNIMLEYQNLIITNKLNLDSNYVLEHNLDFNKALKDLKIKNISVIGNDIKIIGENFPPYLRVKVNGYDKYFKVYSKSELYIENAFENLNGENEEVDMEIYMLDDKGNYLINFKKKIK